MSSRSLDRVNALQTGSFGDGEVLSLLILESHTKDQISRFFWGQKIDLESALKTFERHNFDIEELRKSFEVVEKIQNGEEISKSEYESSSKSMFDFLLKLEGLKKDKSKHLVANYFAFAKYGAGRKILTWFVSFFIFVSVGVQLLANTESGRNLVSSTIDFSNGIKRLFFTILIITMFGSALVIGVLIFLEKRSGERKSE